MIRNLLYSCCALSHSEEWRMNIERLCLYPEAFNGRRIILLKTGDGLEDPCVVRREFSALGDCEFVEMPNDPVLYEVAGFLDGLAMLESQAPDEITFFGHTKGVSYVGVSAAHMRGVRRWRNIMYDELLSDPFRIERVLQESYCAGCFRITGYMPNLSTQSNWHFAGTFWWVRHDALFSRAWRTLDQAPISRRWAVESYLGGLFPIESGTCLYGEHPGSLYEVENLMFVCECGHKFLANVKPQSHPKRVCPKCFKRKAVLYDV